MRGVIPILVFAGVLLACGPDVLHGGELRLVMRTLERSSGTCAQGPCVTIKVEYPEFLSASSKGIRDSLNVFIQETLLGKSDPGGVAPVLEAVLDTVAGEQRASHQGATESPWTIERRIKVIGDTAGILSLRVMECRDTGGAHPESMSLFYVIDQRTTRVLALEDFVPPASIERVRVLAEGEFRKVRGITSTADLQEAGFTFADGKFALTMNVGLISDGVLFFYNPYEVAPYSMGPTELVVPWKSLAGIVSFPSPPGPSR